MSKDGSIPPDHDKDKKKKEEEQPNPGYQGVKKPKRRKPCSLQGVEGLEIKEVKKPQSMGSKLSRMMLIYLGVMLLMGTCRGKVNTTPSSLTPPKQEISQMLPGYVDLYNHRNLEYSTNNLFNKGAEQASKNGEILGMVGQGYELLSEDGNNLIGYVAPGGLYNLEGKQVANVDKKGVFSDLYGRNLGILKIVDQKTETYQIVDSKDPTQVLHELGKKEYVILNEKTTKVNQKDITTLTLEGVIDGYKLPKDRETDGRY